MTANNLSELINKLKKIKDLDFNRDTPLKKYTTIRVGGPADIFLIPHTITAMRKALLFINDYKPPLFILGRGSNIIAADSGFRGIIIYTGQLDRIKINNKTIEAQSGVKLSTLAARALEAGLSGLEFTAGIPGTIGGALYMNAGAYGSEIKDIVINAELLDQKGRLIVLNNEQLKFSYRYSILQDNQLLATKVFLRLKPADKDKITTTMKELNKKRNQKQPLQSASAGSAFKRPPDNYAGYLIEKAGLKGTRIGKARVSEKHAGFIINTGNATAADLRKLFRLVQKKVYEDSGIRLEPEPIFIGDFRQ